MFRRTLFAMALSMLCVAPFLSSQADAADKIGICNDMRFGQQSEAGKEMERQMVALFGKDRQQLEKTDKDINAQVADYKKQAPALSEKAKKDREQKIQRQVQDFQKKGAALQQKIAKFQQAVVPQMNEVLLEACNAVAERDGYSIVVSISACIYSKKSNDITDAVIEEGNKIWQKKGGKFDLKGVK